MNKHEIRRHAVRSRLLASLGLASLLGLALCLMLLPIVPTRAQGARPQLVSLTLSRDELVGPGSVTAAVTLSGPAPAGGAMVTLLTMAEEAIPVPPSVTVAAGETTAHFVITVEAAALTAHLERLGGMSLFITAFYDGEVQRANLSLPPPANLLLESEVPDSAPATGTASLPAESPPGGVLVTLASDRPEVAQVPPSVTIRPGSWGARFPITVHRVAAPTPVTISVTRDGVTWRRTLTVLHDPFLSITFSPESVQGNEEAIGTITLDSPAPAGGALIELSYRNPGSYPEMAGYEPRVTVPAGSTTASFRVRAPLVTETTSVSMSASYGGVTRRGVLIVRPPTLTSLTLSPGQVAGGASATASVTLSGPAPADGESTYHWPPQPGMVISLASSDPQVAAVPDRIAVLLFSTSATFPIETTAVTRPTRVVITAVKNGVTRTATLTVVPDPFVALTFTPEAAVAGLPCLGTVTLSEPAPPGGAAVTLVSDKPGVAEVPVSVTIPAGETTAGFPITTFPHAAPPRMDMYEGAERSVILSASYAGITRRRELIVLPLLSSVEISVNMLTGGATATGTVVLNGPAPEGGVVIPLASAYWPVARVPESVFVPAGETRASFTFTTPVVEQLAFVDVTATYQFVPTKGVLAVLPPKLAAVTVEPAEVAGGTPATGTVTLTGPAPDVPAEPNFSGGFYTVPRGVRVSLSSDRSAVAAVPPSVLVPAGAVTATFPIVTPELPDAAEATITASSGDVTRTAKVTVVPATFVLRVAPSQIVGGAGATGTVVLHEPAPAGGAVILLASDAAAAAVPESVTVPAGETSATFPVTTSPVSARIRVTLSAAYQGPTRTAAVTVLPADWLSLDLDLTAAPGRTSLHGRITLRDPAPKGGLEVTLTSDNEAVWFPVTVTVPEGATGAVVPLTANLVAAPTMVTLTASHAGVADMATLTVLPGLASITFSPDTIEVGQGATGVITLSGPAPPGGFRVALETSDPVLGTIPEAATVAEGATTATFAVTTSRLGGMPNWPEVRVYNSATGVSGTLTVLPLILSSVRLNPSTVGAGKTATGTVVLHRPAPPGGVTIDLSSQKPAVATMPPSVTVPEGAVTAGFAVAAAPDPGPAAPYAATTILATYAGVNKSAELYVLPVELVDMTFDRTRVRGGETVTGTLTLSKPCPRGGIEFRLESENRLLGTLSQERLFIGEGQTTAAFTVKTSEVARLTSVVISTGLLDVTRETTLWLLPPDLIGVSVHPSPVAAGATATGTVTLHEPAPAGGSVIALSSSDPAAATVPASVTVEAGEMSATFPVTTHARFQPGTVVITALYSAGAGGGVVKLSVGGEARTATLAIFPVRGIAVFRPSTQEWFLRDRDGRARVVPFGGPGDRPVPADYLGTGQAQVAVFRPATREWFIRDEEGRTIGPIPFGGPDDVPVPGDYLGLGRAQIAVFRTTTQEWFLRHDDGSATLVQFGAPGDVPAPADYFGLGRVQIAVYRPGTGEWFLRRDDGSTAAIPWGGPGDVPVPGDYLGLGRAFLAVFRPTTRQWFLRRDDGTAAIVEFGGPEDQPMPGDYFGLGRASLTVFRPGTAEWFLRTDAGATVPVQWGMLEDQALCPDFKLRP